MATDNEGSDGMTTRDPWAAREPGSASAVPSVAAASGGSREWQLIEKLLTAAQDEQRRARRWGLVFKGLVILYLFTVLFMIAWPGSPSVSSTTDHVGVVNINGVIMPDGDASADFIVTGLREAFKAKHAKALLLRINSPGGSPVQSGIVYDEIRRLRAEHPDKKVYAVIGDAGASGAYYIAAAADEIYVDKASIVGSIGVIMSNFGAQELIRKLGIESRTMTAGENKNLLDPFSPVNEAHRVHVQQLLDTIHQQFIAAVKEGRGERLKDDPAIFSGLFWTGEQAVQLGLADGLGSAGYVAREVIGIDEVIDYSLQRSPFERFVERFGTSIGNAVASRVGLEPSLR